MYMAGNDKYLAPREQGVVYAAVRRRFRREGTVPLSRIAWRIVPQRNGWVMLQHVLTGRWLRLVAPPSDVQWVVRAELETRPYGKQSWFKVERADGSVVDVASGAGGGTEAHLRAHATGAYINYRVDDMIRGHGNAMRGGKWVASDRTPSTRLTLETLSAADLIADGKKWEAQRQACFAPCADAEAAAATARKGGLAWSEVCWKHYAEPTCSAILRAHAQQLAGGDGALSHLLQVRWARLDCDKYVERPATTPQTKRAQAGGLLATGNAAAMPGGEAHCAPLTEGIIVIAVSDRPNQFLCHYFESALLHGLRPTVLGWDNASWTARGRGFPRPWTYHLGAKLVLPLEYLQVRPRSHRT